MHADMRAKVSVDQMVHRPGQLPHNRMNVPLGKALFTATSNRSSKDPRMVTSEHSSGCTHAQNENDLVSLCLEGINKLPPASDNNRMK